jgi:N utilization substance protein A
MDELNGERIDIINYNPNTVQFLKVALAPAKVSFIDLEEKRAKVYVEEDQRPLAIGRSGQNVRLASKLVGIEIDILDVKDSGIFPIFDNLTFEDLYEFLTGEELIKE